MAFTSASTSPPSAPPVSMLHGVRSRWRDLLPLLCWHDQHGARRESKSKSMREHSIRPPVATLSPGVDRGMWLAIALTPIARLRRSVDVCLCPSICFVFFCRASNIPSTVATCGQSRRRSHYFFQAGASRSCLPACSGVMGPRAPAGMSSSAQNIRGVPETHFWRECIHILPKVRFCTMDGQWTDSGRYNGR